MTPKLTKENIVNKYSLLSVVEYRQILAVSTLLDRPQPNTGSKASTSMKHHSPMTIRSKFVGVIKTGYKNDQWSATNRSTLIRVTLKLDAPKKKMVSGMTTRHGISGCMSVLLSTSATLSGIATAP